jgi:hypothetical protein
MEIYHFLSGNFWQKWILTVQLTVRYLLRKLCIATKATLLYLTKEPLALYYKHFTILNDDRKWCHNVECRSSGVIDDSC